MPTIRLSWPSTDIAVETYGAVAVVKYKLNHLRPILVGRVITVSVEQGTLS